ncbi:transposase [Rothia kristinae]|uniref:Transposase n=1 Tax=Rothia kristinae TaxID=37923 RepID=A0A7T4T4I8_9MICC|nr:integrase core domain-containing protein [Rothia kristinae]QQC59702.1 transposase [Rothia kristinae]
MAEALNSLFKAEVVYRRKAWAPASALEVGVLEWVHRYNTTRIHSAIGYTTRCEAEAT